MGLKLKANKDAIVFNKDKPVLVSGAYYIPQIDENGVLTWVPTGAEMPVVDPFNVVGPAGEPGNSGIYVGSEMPTDEDVYLWVDTEGEIAEAITETELTQAITASEAKTETAIQEAIDSITIVDEVSF
jgi:hypothetical protein